MKKLLTAFAFVVLLFSCSEKNGTEHREDPGPRIPADAVCYTTTSDWKKRFEKSDLYLTETRPQDAKEVDIDETQTFQTIDGFGSAMTWATCYNLMQMPPSGRTAAMKELFDTEEGLGISLVRVTIGASDFNLTNYTWCDKKGIENFAVHPDDSEYVFPVLKEMFEINPDVRIIASPWSAPKWMKRVSYLDNSPYDSWTGGSINNDCMPDYATYFVKWIQEMESRGFPIYAVTLQNEPLNNGNSISMGMTYPQQVKFIKEAVGPAFEKAGIKARILAYDHNFNYDNQSGQKDYPAYIFKDAAASKYVAGSAWHNYGGQPSDIDNIIREYPEKEIFFTEATIGDWNYQNPGERLIADFRQIYMQMLVRGCRGVTLWNTVLDEKHGPYNPEPGSCKTSFGLLNVNSVSHEIFERSSHYYCTAHTSKVIRQGAVRLASSCPAYGYSGETVQVFRNPDGTYAAIILNSSSKALKFSFKVGSRWLTAECPAGSIVSIKW